MTSNTRPPSRLYLVGALWEEDSYSIPGPVHCLGAIEDIKRDVGT
jgi:hypothetical protein